MISSGEIIVTDPDGKPAELRRFLGLGTKLDVWKLGSGYRVDITRLVLQLDFMVLAGRGLCVGNGRASR